MPYKYRRKNVLLSNSYTSAMFTSSMKVRMHYIVLLKLLGVGRKEAGQATGETHDGVHRLLADSGSEQFKGDWTFRIVGKTSKKTKKKRLIDITKHINIGIQFNKDALLFVSFSISFFFQIHCLLK